MPGRQVQRGRALAVAAIDRRPVREAQHDAAASCIHIHEVSQSRFILGMSATPYRTDTLKLAFKRVVKDAGIHRLIQEGWLCPYQHWAIEEWTPQSVADTYLTEPARWGKSVVFFPTVLECQQFAAILGAQGCHCEVITADTDREPQLDAFDAGEFSIVANVAILNEGFDCPDLRTVFVRDSSRLPTVQMAGRGFPQVLDELDAWPSVSLASPSVAGTFAIELVPRGARCPLRSRRSCATRFATKPSLASWRSGQPVRLIGEWGLGVGE